MSGCPIIMEKCDLLNLESRASVLIWCDGLNTSHIWQLIFVYNSGTSLLLTRYKISRYFNKAKSFCINNGSSYLQQWYHVTFFVFCDKFLYELSIYFYFTFTSKILNLFLPASIDTFYLSLYTISYLYISLLFSNWVIGMFNLKPYALF